MDGIRRLCVSGMLLIIMMALTACSGGGGERVTAPASGGSGGSSSGGGGTGGSSVTVWSTEELIEVGAGNAVFPQVAMNGSGNAIAVWRQWDGMVWSIYANRYDAISGVWLAEELIETGVGDTLYQPDVAMDGNGDAIAVWRQWDGTVWSIYANRYDAASGTWLAEELIETGTGTAGYSVVFPQVAMDGNGNAIAVWSQHDGTVDSTYANHYDAVSGAWSGEELIEAGSWSTGSPQVAMDGSGNAMAVWYQWDGGMVYNLYANRYNVVSGAWSGEVLIEAGTGDVLDPQVAMDGSGNTIAVLRQWDGTAWSIYANRYNAASGTWLAEELIETGTGTAGYSVGFPQVAMDGNGNAIAVWSQHDTMGSSTYANHYDAVSGAWSIEEAIEAGAGAAFSQPRVVMGVSGNAIAVWSQSDGTVNSIYANRYTAIP